MENLNTRKNYDEKDENIDFYIKQRKKKKALMEDKRE